MITSLALVVAALARVPRATDRTPFDYLLLDWTVWLDGTVDVEVYRHIGVAFHVEAA